MVGEVVYRRLKKGEKPNPATDVLAVVEATSASALARGRGFFRLRPVKAKCSFHF